MVTLMSKHSYCLWLCLCLPFLSLSAAVLPGIDVFLQGYTYLVKGQRVGLITNQTGVDRNGIPSIDLLYRHPDVNLVALFAPEHGIRGTLKAGELVPDARDQKTGLKIYSLYGGKDHRPPKIGLDHVDVLIYDIQDVGSRAYTYIWSMAEAMAAAGEAGKSFIVLDRPNPLGCISIDGPITETQWISFLGLYPIPRVYGLTVGELARYLNREHHLQCRLMIIPMAGYRRSMTWPETGLNWVAPSPNIPSPESAYCFGATGTIGTLNLLQIGIGTDLPFQMVGASWLDSENAAKTLNRSKLPGVHFHPFQFVPKSGSQSGVKVNAVRLEVVDPRKFKPATTELHILSYLRNHYPRQLVWQPDRIPSFDKAMGTSSVREKIVNNENPDKIARQWDKEIAPYRQRQIPYHIYP